MRAAGVPALFLNSTLSPEAYQENMDYVKRGQTKLLYMAPETLLTPRIFQLLSEVKVDCLTIDEAHCISEWGHDFRPEYRQLTEVRKRFPWLVIESDGVVAGYAVYRTKAEWDDRGPKGALRAGGWRNALPR